jgi:hypothetical protein
VRNRRGCARARTRVRLGFGQEEGDDRWGPPVGDNERWERAERAGGGVLSRLGRRCATWGNRAEEKEGRLQTLASWA